MQVADCYIRVKYRRLSEEEFNGLSERLFNMATGLAEGFERGQELDFTFGEGTIWMRLLLLGNLMVTGLDFASHYHDLRESVKDMVHDGEQVSDYAIHKFHEITNTKRKDDIYKRTSSRDMNRLRRIITRFDQASGGNIPRSELPHIRREIIHDLAGLARANPDDPEIAKIFHLLPRDRIPGIPTSPHEAIAIDDTEFEHKPKPHDDEPQAEPTPSRPRRRFHQQMIISRRKSR